MHEWKIVDSFKDYEINYDKIILLQSFMRENINSTLVHC